MSKPITLMAAILNGVNFIMAKIENYIYEEITVGQSAEMQHAISQQDILTFAALSGDVNPLHLDAAYAATTPFKQVVAHGMLSASFISAVLGSKFPGPGTVYLSQNLIFHKPVYVDATIAVVVTVMEKLSYNRLILDCKCYDQNAQLVCSGLAKVVAPAEKQRCVPSLLSLCSKPID